MAKSKSKKKSAIDVAGKFLRKKVIRADYTGSRVICPSALIGRDSDIDILVQVPNLADGCRRLVNTGFEGGEGSLNEAGEPSEGSKFASLKLDKLNIIATDDAAFYDSFMLATRVAMRLGLNHKSDRVSLFQAILYGNG